MLLTSVCFLLVSIVMLIINIENTFTIISATATTFLKIISMVIIKINISTVPLEHKRSSVYNFLTLGILNET